MWAKALASLEDDSWCPDIMLLEEFRKTLAEVAANRLLDDECLQQLQKAFPALMNKDEAVSARVQQLQHATMSSDSARKQPSNVSGDTMHVMARVQLFKDCAVLVVQLY